MLLMLAVAVLLCRKLLQFGVLEGLIRRVQKYPVQLLMTEASFSRVSQQQQQPLRQLSKYLEGSQCYDEISCHTGQSSSCNSVLIVIRQLTVRHELLFFNNNKLLYCS